MAPRSQNVHLIDGGDTLPLLGYSTRTDAVAIPTTKKETVASFGGLGASKPQLSPSNLSFATEWLFQGLSVGPTRPHLTTKISDNGTSRPGLGGHKYS